jgi:hypothetical protein
VALALAELDVADAPSPSGVDISPNALNARIEALRTGFAGHQTRVRTRARALLSAYSPDFEIRIGEFDQWPDPFRSEDDGHARNSYNLTRAVVEIWSALEASKYPTIRWNEGYMPTPAPSTDPVQSDMNQEYYRASKRVARQIATMREQTLLQHVRRAKAARHFYNAVTRRNVFGLAWLKTVPDLSRKTFRIMSRIDAATVFPVWSMAEDRRLDAVLVAYRKSAQTVNAQYPGTLPMSRDGLSLDLGANYYETASDSRTDADRAFVWVEDYWMLDDQWEEEVGDDAEPIVSRVVNAVRVNGVLVDVTEWPGWTRLPYIPFEIDNLRDNLGFSDAGTMLPIQSGINRFLSQQEDVIFGESRPKFKYRGDADREIVLRDDEVVSLDPDEDIEQIKVSLDVFPTQVHGQQLLEVLARTTGLSDAVWGRITQAANSGRALAVAWRAVASRMIPRTQANEEALEGKLQIWLDWMELYGWDNAGELYNGNRDFALDFPNQEPRDFTEIVMTAINKLNVGGIDLAGAMEEWGETSPDEMLERVRTDYMDPVLHPEKSQSMLLLQRLKNQIAIEAQQAGIQAATAQAQLSQMGAQPQGNPGQTVDQAAGQAANARAGEAARNAPQLGQGDNAPASQPGTGPNAGNSTQFGTLVQDGKTFNRVIDKGQIAP